MVNKRVGTFALESTEEQFAQILTPYALDFVVKQLNFRKKVVIVKDKRAHSVVSFSAGNLTFTVNSCQCTFWKTMHLPCRHMFAVREISKCRYVLISTRLFQKDGKWFIFAEQILQ